MKALLIAAMMCFSLHAQAQSLETFFSHLEGGWSLVTGQSHGLDADGHSNGTWTHTLHNQNIVRSGQTWTDFGDHCGSVRETMCGLFEEKWIVNGETLHIVWGQETIRAEISELTPNRLAYSFERKGISYFVSQELTPEHLVKQTMTTHFPDGSMWFDYLTSQPVH